MASKCDALFVDYFQSVIVNPAEVLRVPGCAIWENFPFIVIKLYLEEEFWLKCHRSIMKCRRLELHPCKFTRLKHPRQWYLLLLLQPEISHHLQNQLLGMCYGIGHPCFSSDKCTIEGKHVTNCERRLVRA